MKVGTKAFQDWIIDRLGELYPTRDYTRAMEFSTTIELKAILPDELKEQIDNIASKIEEYQEDKRDEIADILTEVEGFREVPKELEDANNHLKNVITDNLDYQDFMNKLNELMTHPFMTKEHST